jgi:hypothetical protein
VPGYCAHLPVSGLHDRTLGIRHIQRSIDSSPSGLACLYVTLSRRAAQAGFADMQFQAVFNIVKEFETGMRDDPVFLMSARRADA